eukprot:9228241-Prorocentrum_lima.AAC.1
MSGTGSAPIVQGEAVIDRQGLVEMRHAGVHTRVTKSAQPKFLELKRQWAEFIRECQHNG